MAKAFPFRLAFLLLLSCLHDALCSNSSTIRSESCRPSGYLRREAGRCDGEDPDCCQPGKSYPKYLCSPQVTTNTPATMSLLSFPGDIDDDYPWGCDGKFHRESELLVALSTGWYDRGRRCLTNIKINANGKSVVAKVIDECDSANGCDAEHDYEQPCANNEVDASLAVWEALGIPKAKVGVLNITWSDE